jgi:hypothetical protein
LKIRSDKTQHPKGLYLKRFDAKKGKLFSVHTNIFHTLPFDLDNWQLSSIRCHKNPISMELFI